MHLQFNDSKEFAAKLKSSIQKDNAIILLHATWCYWCKQFRPEWDKFVKGQKDNENLMVVEIEADQLERIKQKTTELYDLIVGNESIGFPCVVLFAKGQRYTYEGERTETALKSHLNNVINDKKQSGGMMQAIQKQRAALNKLERRLNTVARNHMAH